VASGRIPGYVAAVRVGGQVEVRAGGRTAVETDSAPMGEDTLFRIASVTKPMGGALTLSLVQDGALTLDDPIARWLPEAANPRVLVAPDAPLDRTTEVQRPITVRHLLTMTCGWGAVLEETPLRTAMMERGVYPGPLTPQMSGDEFVARIADLTADALTDAQRRQALAIVGPGGSWGLGTGVDVEAAEPWMAPGRWGLGRRDGDDRARRPDARHRWGPLDAAGDDRPAGRFR
jgi:hypothetical protein